MWLSDAYLSGEAMSLLSAAAPPLPQTQLPLTTSSVAAATSRPARNNHSPRLLQPYPSLPRLCALVARSSSSFQPLPVSDRPGFGDGVASPPLSATAVAVSIRRASPNSPVEFVHRVEKGGESKMVMPSPEFHRLCLEQLDLFQTVVDRNAVLSVYVRPAGSYVMDQLELRRVIFYPGVDVAEPPECVIVVANFGAPAGLHAAEAALSNHQVDVIPEHGAIVLPMVKHPFVVGFLVAEIPFMEPETVKTAQNDGHRFSLSSSANEPFSSPRVSDRRIWEMQSFKDDSDACHQFTEEQRSRAVLITRSLAMAYVMDQRAILLQHSSWQNSVRMSQLVEQIRAPLSSIRTLSKMLSVYAKRTEISYDIVEDILVQGNQMKETLQQLQDAVYFTKANIMRYNEESFKKIHDPSYGHPELLGSSSSNEYSIDNQECKKQKMDFFLPLSSATKDAQMPMPPLALAPQQQNIRPCNVSDILEDLVGAARPLAHRQQRLLELREDSLPLPVAVEESALRQALSNLIEGALLRTHVGGGVQIVATGAPAGGALIVIDDDGPDMQYMTQMHSLAPFGADLFSDGMVQDNMTWNFVAGLTVSREILESYGCVVRVISPRKPDAALGAGGTRIELWLPAFGPDLNQSYQEA